MIDDISDFLEDSGWHGATRVQIAGDASSRQYQRLVKANGSSAVLMIDRSAETESIQWFLALSDSLRSNGLSAPAILAQRVASGLALLEDFGELRFADGLGQGIYHEEQLYSAAIDTLLAMQRITTKLELAAPMPRDQAHLTDVAFSWYVTGTERYPSDQHEGFFAVLETVLAEIAPSRLVPAHRDFHAENLFWLPDREGPARVGLIDFQDMFFGHPVYDLVSLLTDARRDITLDLRRQMLGYFCQVADQPRRDVERAFAVISVQRNTRILGVFARLAIRDHKLQYLALIPRVWRYIDEALSHPELATLAEPLRRTLPAPDTGHLEKLRAAC